jgi:hypothetical protein
VVLVAMVAAYFATAPKPGAPQPIPIVSGEPRPAGPGAYAETEVIGPEDAKLKIVALVPVVNPCHAGTVKALKEAAADHPEDIQLTLVDFFNPEDSAKWKGELGVTCATVEINGDYTFELEGRTVTFQKQEGGTYQPADLETVIEGALAEAG